VGSPSTSGAREATDSNQEYKGHAVCPQIGQQQLSSPIHSASIAEVCEEAEAADPRFACLKDMHSEGQAPGLTQGMR
jgi:hypothetical protein